MQYDKPTRKEVVWKEKIAPLHRFQNTNDCFNYFKE